MSVGTIFSSPKLKSNTVGSPRTIETFQRLAYVNVGIGIIFGLFSLWMLIEPRVWFGIKGTFTSSPGAEDMEDLHPGYLHKKAEKFRKDSMLQTQMAENIANQSIMFDDLEEFLD